jgi:hypothetical protein
VACGFRVRQPQKLTDDLCIEPAGDCRRQEYRARLEPGGETSRADQRQDGYEKANRQLERRQSDVRRCPKQVPPERRAVQSERTSPRKGRRNKGVDPLPL